MKQSFGSKWKLPSNWQTVPIKEVTDDWRGGAPFKPDDFTEEGFPVLHKGAVQRNGKVSIDPKKKTFTTEAYANAHTKSVIDRSHMAVTLRDLVPSGPSIGLMADLSQSPSSQYILAQGAYGFQIDHSRIIPSYLVWLSNYEPYRAYLRKYAVGSTQIHIRTPIFQNLKIPLPPIAEQKRIAAILDKADAIRRKRKEAIALTEELLRSTFLDMFGDPVTNPKGWPEKPLSDFLETIIDYRGKTPPKSESGIPLISAANVHNGKVDFKYEQYISDADYAQWTTRGFTQPGDILITTEAPVGEVAPYPETGIFQISRRIMALRPYPDIVSSNFLLYSMLNDNWLKRLRRVTRGSTVPRVLKPDILKQPIPQAPMELQKRFEEFYQGHKNLSEHLGKTPLEVNNLFNTLLQRAFRGDL